MMNQNKTVKTFINVKFPSGWVLYATHVVMFGIIPLGLIMLMIQALRISEFHISILILLLGSVMSLVLILLAVSFYMFRNYVPYKINTDDAGLRYSSLLRTVRIGWDQILSIKINKGLLTGNSFKLRTGTEHLNIPIYMKEKDNPYPKLSILNNCWVTADNSELQLSADNCPLFIEIKRHIAPHLTTGSTADRD
jgi:hypothetical protein